MESEGEGVRICTSGLHCLAYDTRSRAISTLVIPPDSAIETSDHLGPCSILSTNESGEPRDNFSALLTSVFCRRIMGAGPFCLFHHNTSFTRDTVVA